MKGFSNRFADFPDYILKITKDIWEDRDIGPSLKSHYHPDVIVRMPSGISIGEPATTAATMSTLSELPDRVLLGEDVIWSGTPEEGMLSSHRILSTATHRGGGTFSSVDTGLPVRYRILADCYAKDDMISDEWLLRDNAAVLHQLGLDVEDWARARVAANPDLRPVTKSNDVVGPYTGRGNDNEWGAKLADLLTRLMQAEFSVIPAEWDRAAQVHYAGARDGHGHRDADRHWLRLRAAFPSATFAVHHVIGREDPMMAPRASVRWSLDGLHDGWGAFGPPSGAPVHIMGITQAEFGPWGLRQEHTLIDETAVWTQIAQHQG